MPLMGRWDTHWNSLSGGTEIKDHEGRVGGGGEGREPLPRDNRRLGLGREEAMEHGLLDTCGRPAF